MDIVDTFFNWSVLQSSLPLLLLAKPVHDTKDEEYE